MPYIIEQGCDSKPDWWAVKDIAGEQFGCHETKQDAINQAVAISLADDEPFLGERKADGPKIIVSDIDGTLLDNGVNLNETVWAFIQRQDGALFIVTGRPESERDKTTTALHDAGVTFSRLIMNPGSTADSPAYKKATMAKLLETYDVVVALENDPTTLGYYRELGVKSLNPDEMRENKSMEKTIETRVSPAEFEIRETADGMTFTGYAAVFNSRSENLGGFTEFVAPGAFTRSLKTRNDVKLLWNHDTSIVLGSTRARTLSLTEDEKGLRVEAQLPNTSAGRDAAELLKRGDVDSMSFGFSVIKDSWNTSGDERTLNAVRLHEVSVVAFPAYPETAGTTSVRSFDVLATRAQVDPDLLSSALTRLETGQDLDNDSRDLLLDVIGKVSPAVEVNPEPEPSMIGDLGLLALKKKRLELYEL
jgi:HK97 family phage prohead protease